MPATPPGTGAGKSRTNRTTHSRCSFVSGTSQPRAAAIRSHADAGSTPLATRTQAANRAALPIPCRQWMATFSPNARRCSSRRTKSKAAFVEGGRPRSAMGKTMKSIRIFSHKSHSWAKSNSAFSSLVRAETIAWIPIRFQEEISSSSQSPPRGRGTIANRPGHGPSIQYTSVRMACPKALAMISRGVDANSQTTSHHLPPTRIKSCAFSSNAAITASSSDKPDALKRFCVSRTRR
jgi:hypothetical protein